MAAVATTTPPLVVVRREKVAQLRRVGEVPAAEDEDGVVLREQGGRGREAGNPVVCLCAEGVDGGEGPRGPQRRLHIRCVGRVL